MITAKILLNRSHRLISVPLKQRYLEKYPEHEVSVSFHQGAVMKPSLVIESLQPAGSISESECEESEPFDEREAKEFMYQNFIHLFVELHGKYPWDMPR